MQIKLDVCLVINNFFFAVRYLESERERKTHLKSRMGVKVCCYFLFYLLGCWPVALVLFDINVIEKKRKVIDDQSDH